MASGPRPGSPGLEMVVARAAADGVGARLAEQRLRSGPAVEDVVAGAALQEDVQRGYFTPATFNRSSPPASTTFKKSVGAGQRTVLRSMTVQAAAWMVAPPSWNSRFPPTTVTVNAFVSPGAAWYCSSSLLLVTVAAPAPPVEYHNAATKTTAAQTVRRPQP